MNLDDDTVDELPAPPRKEISAADLELLMLAARALGARFEEVEGEGYGNLHFEDGRVVHSWNPLQFSGDALELAVELDMAVMPYGEWEEGVPLALVRTYTGLQATELHNCEPLVATRRAITRVAAEIGKQRS